MLSRMVLLWLARCRWAIMQPLGDITGGTPGTWWCLMLITLPQRQGCWVLKDGSKVCRSPAGNAPSGMDADCACCRAATEPMLG